MFDLTNDASRLLKELPESLFVIDANGIVEFFNEAAERQTGYSAVEITGEHVSVLMPTDERRKLDVVAWLQRWASDPNPDQLRYLTLTGRHRDGSDHQYRVRVSALGGGEVTSFAVLLRDVTEELAEVLRLRHDYLVSKRIIDIGADAVLSIDADQRICFWNRAAEQLFGYRESEILGQALDRLVPEGLRTGHGRQVADFIQGTEPSRMMGQRGEIQGLHRDGSPIALEASITKTEVGGSLVLSAQIRDITERKRQEAALLESESRFRAVFENALEAIALLDGQGRILMINGAALSLLPESADYRGQTLWDMDWWRTGSMDNRRDLEENVRRAASGETVRLRTVLNTAGGDREIDFSLIPVFGESGLTATNILAEARALDLQETPS